MDSTNSFKVFLQKMHKSELRRLKKANGCWADKDKKEVAFGTDRYFRFLGQRLASPSTLCA